MESVSEPTKCPRCGEDMTQVTKETDHFHCDCGCCLWDGMQLTWNKEVYYKEEHKR